MNKNYWLAASGTLAVASAMMLFSAHRIEAQFSQPVRVLNTSAGPVLTSRIDDPGRIAYLSSTSTTCGANSCGFTFPAVPAGHRVVIQHVSAVLAFSGTPTTLLGFVTSSANNGSIQFAVASTPVTDQALFDQPVLYYVDAGQSATVTIGSPVSFNPNALQQTMTLVGYELDCNAAPCAAIANH
jgi:hypothetical protein